MCKSSALLCRLSCILTSSNIQVQEVIQHEPDCKVYFALTKCDLLEQPPAFSSHTSNLEPSPQESGLHLISTLCHCLFLPHLSSTSLLFRVPCFRVTRLHVCLIEAHAARHEGQQQLHWCSCMEATDLAAFGGMSLCHVADQSELAATPDSGKGSFSSEEGATICQQEVSDDDISAYATSHQAQVFTTSAKTGIGVRRMFTTIAEDMAASTVQETQTQHIHRHVARPVTPTFMSSRPNTNPTSPLENPHKSTFTRTRKKYFQNCCF